MPNNNHTKSVLYDVFWIILSIIQNVLVWTFSACKFNYAKSVVYDVFWIILSIIKKVCLGGILADLMWSSRMVYMPTSGGIRSTQQVYRTLGMSGWHMLSTACVGGQFYM